MIDSFLYSLDLNFRSLLFFFNKIFFSSSEHCTSAHGYLIEATDDLFSLLNILLKKKLLIFLCSLRVLVLPG